MKIQLNGEPLSLDDGSTLYRLIEQRALQGKRIAVEVNEELVTRSNYSDHLLREGDQVEIVQAIGGG